MATSSRERFVRKERSRELVHPEYRADIDGLRAIAVLSVVGYHAFPNWVRGGFVGVDVFFVISGFLISGIILGSFDKGLFSFSKFYARRIKRIFPALVVVLVSCLVCGWFVLLADEYKLLGKHVAAGAGFVSNILLWTESGYFDITAKTKPLLHLWSLGIEEQFYIAWPLLLFLSWKLRFDLLWLMLTFVATTFALNIALVAGDPVATFYLPFTRFWELLLGGILAHLALRNVDPSRILSQRLWKASSFSRTANIQSLVGIALIGLSVLTFDDSFAYPGSWALLPTVGTYLSISSGQIAWLNRKVLSHPALVWIGLISYPLYLWHWVLLSFSRINAGQEVTRGVRVAAILISVVLAWLTYELVEKGIKRTRKSTVALALLTVIIVITVLGFLVFEGKIFAKPTTPIQSGILRSYDASKPYRLKQCFLEPNKQGPDSFSPNCMEHRERASGENRLVLLWGDSLAAQLYPGIKTLQDEYDFDLAQRTAGSCPPLMGGSHESNRKCDEINTATRQFIVDKIPSVVLLSSRWSRDLEGLELKIESTVSFLKNAGVRTIVLFGPAPAWTPTLPYVLLRKEHVTNFVPEYLQPPKEDFSMTLKIENRLQRVSERLRVSYVSLIRSFCEGQKCRVRVGDNFPDDLIAYDSDHLTENSSIYLFARPSVRSTLASLFKAPLR